MTTLNMRQKIISYLADAEENKVKAIYTLLERDIDEGEAFLLSDEQLDILEQEEELHLTGKTKSYTKDEAIQIIRRQRDF
ncbi:hypothetical protein [Mucilaginibacter gilvus]|uniref:Addiction module protein n=1 Tax=Mucilaginibacter gilvus TaxID=2305909 RepID=A0A444MUX8_9SPHI|nr:hypothetical protein [Mucilaginibacter gilvus]RWY57365.1 hypothetical protein EPL05_02190 [Mucilaginibacter gilvus]